MKQFNSDKKITSKNQSDKLKSIIDNNIKGTNYSQKNEDTKDIDIINDDNQDLENEIEYLEKNRINFNEPENELFSEDDELVESKEIKSKYNNKEYQSKPKLSFKTIFVNSDFYLFFKVWLNLNRWGVFFYLIMTSATIVYFIANVMTVNKLMTEIRQLNKIKNEMNGKNKILEVKLVEMQSPDRINKIATESMGFQKATEAPFFIKNTINE